MCAISQIGGRKGASWATESHLGLKAACVADNYRDIIFKTKAITNKSNQTCLSTVF